VTGDGWGAPLVIDLIQNPDDEEGISILGHAFAENIRDSTDRALLAIGSRQGPGGRIYYLLGDDHPEHPLVTYVEAAGYVELARELMRQFGLTGDCRIEWEQYSERPVCGTSQTITVP
jgi:hypothetical protein